MPPTPNKNKVRFGLSNVHYALLTDEQTPTWDTPKAMKGAVSCSVDAEGENSPFFADNGKYWDTYSNNGYTMTLEMAMFPDDFLVDVLGYHRDSNGAVFEVADAQPKPFALQYQIEGDQTGTRYVAYNTKASRPSLSPATTEDSTEPSTESCDITVSPIEIDGRKLNIGHLELNDTNATAYNGFFTEVYVPVDSE